MPFTKVAPNEYKSPSGRKFTGRQVKMYYATNGFTKKKKPKIVINNKMKGIQGAAEFIGKKPTGRVEINLKHPKHKNDKAELASTIKHELMHVKNPTMTEKEVYKRTAKTKISPTEQTQLLSKLRHKKLNYKSGALKRKFKLGKVDAKPGTFIQKMNENKFIREVKQSNPTKLDIAILGAV